MKKFLLCLFLFGHAATSTAQTLAGDSILAAERSIDRLITLHARQLRITGGYGLDIVSRRYQENGETIRLRDEGFSSVRHRISVDLKYGINDFIQVNAAIGRSMNVLREKTHYITPASPEPVVAHQVLKKYSGLEDLYLGVDLRAPLKTRKVDAAITLGAHLAAYEPAQPDHTFVAVQEDDEDVHRFTYRYNNRMGTGVTVARLGGMIKYRAAKWAVAARADYQHGLKVGKSFEWRHQLNHQNSFEYRKDPFIYQLRDALSYFAEVEYQPLTWLDFFLNASGYTSRDGWTSSEQDLKIAMPDQTHFVLSPGVEVIVTPRLWLRGRVNFSVSGESHEAPLAFQTSLMYNVFPF
jgi:hypothetical protein